jgi:hypothetical protein
MHIQGSPAEIQTPNTLQPYRPQHDRPAACAVAQQCSSSTFVSLCFHCRWKKKFYTPSKYVLIFFFFTFSKLRKSEIA